MKHILTLIALLSLPAVLRAQETTAGPDTLWRTSLDVGFNFNQASFSDNWTGGGINSIAFTSLLNANANYRKGVWSWDNELNLLYGVFNNEGQDWRKSQDVILLDSKVGRALSDNWNAYGSVNFLTQFAPGYRYEDLDDDGTDDPRLISDLFAPAFLTFSVGAEYVPNEHFSLRLSPFSPRLTFVRDTTIISNVPANYGVERGETTRYEWLALQILAEYDKDITETVNLQARYQFFANYETFELDKFDHRLDLTVAAQLTSFLTLNFSAIAIYDFDQIDEVQFSQLLGIGLLLQREGVVAR